MASHLGLYCLLRPVCPNTYGKYGSQIPFSATRQTIYKDSKTGTILVFSGSPPKLNSANDWLAIMINQMVGKPYLLYDQHKPKPASTYAQSGLKGNDTTEDIATIFVSFWRKNVHNTG